MPKRARSISPSSSHEDAPLSKRLRSSFKEECADETPPPPSPKPPPLIEAIQGEDEDELKRILADPSTTDALLNDQLFDPLKTAIETGNATIVSLLLSDPRLSEASVSGFGSAHVRLCILTNL